MIKLKDIPEILRDWRTDELRTQDFYELFLDLLEHHEVEEVFTLLPEELQAAFAASLRASFDNNCSADDIIWIRLWPRRTPRQARDRLASAEVVCPCRALLIHAARAIGVTQ